MCHHLDTRVLAMLHLPVIKYLLWTLPLSFVLYATLRCLSDMELQTTREVIVDID